MASPEEIQKRWQRREPTQEEEDARALRSLRVMQILVAAEDRHRYMAFMKRWDLSRSALENKAGPRPKQIASDWSMALTQFKLYLN